MSEKHKIMCRALNHFEHFLVFISAILISAFASSVGIPVGITSSALGFKICAITSVIKKCKSIIRLNF